MDSTERLIDLVVLLLESRTPLTFADIRSRFPDGYPQESLESAKRMFERDKAIAREIGVPLEVTTEELGAEQAYTIRRERFFLKGIDLSASELASLTLAVAGGSPEDPAVVATGKLLSALRSGMGSESDGPSLGPALAGLPISGGDGAARLLEAWEVTVGRRAVAFGYRGADGNRTERSLDPFRVAFRGGRWYLVGHDRDRDAIRAFRLSRIEGEMTDIGDAIEPPADFRAADHIVVGPSGPQGDGSEACVAFAPDAAWLARRSVDVRRETVRADGWIELTIPGGDPEWLASWVLSFGPDAEAVAPPELRDEVVTRLEAARG